MKAKYNLILALLMMLITQISFAQIQTVSGVVTDQGGAPIPGVNVSVKGTSFNSQSDLNGKYKITANQNQTLIFSFIGLVFIYGQVVISYTVAVFIVFYIRRLLIFIC